MSARTVLKEILPPIVLRSIQVFQKSSVRESIGEKESDWYDQAFDDSSGQTVHYTQSPYYPVTTVILDRVRKIENKSVLEIACGAGQLAMALHDMGLCKNYRGFDFSVKRIEQARKFLPNGRFPNSRFHVADVFKTELIEKADYDLVISTEFLEHIKSDLDVLKRIKAGARFIGTVPNYPWVSHVRHFQDAGEVADRYGPHFLEFNVCPILMNPAGQTIFVLEGIKT